jgi:hypothetical protein
MTFVCLVPLPWHRGLIASGVQRFRFPLSLGYHGSRQRIVHRQRQAGSSHMADQAE